MRASSRSARRSILESFDSAETVIAPWSGSSSLNSVSTVWRVFSAILRTSSAEGTLISRSHFETADWPTPSQSPNSDWFMDIARLMVLMFRPNATG